MTKPIVTGPRADKLPLEKMPVERLAEVLPEGSVLSAVVQPSYVSPAPYTGIGDPNDFDEQATGVSFDDIFIIGTEFADNIVLPQYNSEYWEFVVYAGAGNDLVDARPAVFGANVYGGSGDDVISGSGRGRLLGGSGSDIIDGGGASNFIVGGYGADTLSGGGGADTFAYLSARDTGDVILDFESGSDKISLNAFGDLTFQGLLDSPGMVEAGGFGYTARAEGGITVFVDTDGIAGADLEIHVANVETIAVSDFLFI